jgi:predicted heme/steroid binding protein
MTHNDLIFKLVLCQLFELPDATVYDDGTYRVLYTHLKNLVNEIEEKDNNGDDILLNLAAARIVGPIYELYHMEKLGNYKNSDKISMKYEIKDALEDFAARGIFNDTHISKQHLRDLGIAMSEGMWDLI